jgi:hypothetical protein
MLTCGETVVAHADWCRDGSGTCLLVEKPQWSMLAGAETAEARAYVHIG